MNGSDQYGVDVSSCQTIGYSATSSITPSSTPYTGYHQSSYDLSSSKSVYTSNDNPPEYGSSTESAFSTPTWYTPDYSGTPTAGSPSSYQSGYYHHSVYPTDPVAPQKPGYSQYPGKPSNHSYHPGRSSSDFTAVVGAQTKVVERRSIDVLQNDHKDVFNMLILALERLQNTAETQDLSYYQLSGKIWAVL